MFRDLLKIPEKNTVEKLCFSGSVTLGSAVLALQSSISSA